MKVHQLQGPPAPELAQALSEFEHQFSYPLGPGRFFRISHGDDYPRFFRAIGNAACFVAELEGRVLGALAISLRRLVLPDGRDRSVAYLGDLKVAPAARGGAVLLRLARAAETWARPEVNAAFSVVMDGTNVTPPAYTGRAGIPPFQELGKVIVLRLTNHKDPMEDRRFTTTSAQGSASYRELCQQRYAAFGGIPAERSEIAPLWLMHSDRSACGMLEDTRRAKRLIADDGSEMISAHLSFFAFGTPSAGAELLRDALHQAARLGFPALFVAVAEPEVDGLRGALRDVEAVAAPATIYGTGLPPGPLWNINSSEI